MLQFMLGSSSICRLQPDRSHGSKATLGGLNAISVRIRAFLARFGAWSPDTWMPWGQIKPLPESGLPGLGTHISRGDHDMIDCGISDVNMASEMRMAPELTIQCGLA
jgi:hypothetical protein